MYALLPSKSRNDYNRFFTLVRGEMQTLGLWLESERVMADFEISLVQSIELHAVPSSIHQRLLLPFFSVFMEKSPSTRNVPNIRNFIQKSAALPLLNSRRLMITSDILSLPGWTETFHLGHAGTTLHSMDHARTITSRVGITGSSYSPLDLILISGNSLN